MDVEVFVDMVVAGIHVSTKVVQCRIQDHFDVKRGLFNLSLGKIGSGNALVVVKSLPVSTSLCEECINFSLVITVRDSSITNLFSERDHCLIMVMVSVSVSVSINIDDFIIGVASIMELVLEDTGRFERELTIFIVFLADLYRSAKLVK